MPRDGSGIYTYPPGTPGIPDTTIESAKYNGYIADVQQDLNLPRPIVAGGTGANNVTAARDNLDAEVAMQVVTNFDTHPWENGSFYAAPGATSAPVAGHWFIGTFYGTTQWATLQARDLNGSSSFDVYVRTREAGVWNSWVRDSATLISFPPSGNISATNVQAAIQELDAEKVAKAGDTMTGDLTLNDALIFGAVGTGTGNSIFRESSGKLIYAGGTTGHQWNDNANMLALITLSNSGTLTFVNSAAAAGLSIFREINALVYSGGTSGHQWNNNANTIALMTLSDAGDLRLNTSASIAGEQMAITSVASAKFGLAVKNVDRGIHVFSTGAASYAGYFTQGTTANMVGNIFVNSTSTAFNTSSDERLKEDLKSFDAGHIIDDTNVYDFAWKATGERSYGIIAQQAVNVYPAAITFAEQEDRWFVDYSKYVPVILQELKTLRARVAELEGKLTVGI